MNEDRQEVILVWFRKAESDLKNIRNNLASDDVPTDTVCFHAQQAIEKYLKGALVFFERDISKTHDLVKLLSQLRELIPELAALEEEMEQVTEYAVAMRYPDAFYYPTTEETKKSYDTALRVQKIVLQTIRF